MRSRRTADIAKFFKGMNLIFAFLTSQVDISRLGLKLVLNAISQWLCGYLPVVLSVQTTRLSFLAECNADNPVIHSRKNLVAPILDVLAYEATDA